jgi:uncharacterized protein (TIGR03437 family)
LLVAVCLSAQTTSYSVVLPSAKVGEPYDQSLFPKDAGQGGSNQPGGASVTVSAPSGVPPGLSATNSGRLRGTPTQAGNFRITLNGAVTCVTCHGKTMSQPFSVDAVLAVAAGQGGLSLESGTLLFQFSEGSRESATQQARFSNRGSQARTVSAAAPSERWLAAGGGGNVGPYSSLSVPVTVNPSGLAAGVYSSRVVFAAPGTADVFSTAVVVTVTSAQANLGLSQSGMTLLAEQNSGGAPGQTFQVGSSSGGAIPFTATASTTSGGSWLEVSSSGATTPATVSVRAKSAGLSSGSYYGQVEIKSDGAPNSPRVVNVVYNVAPSTGTTVPVISPAGLVMVQKRGVPLPNHSVNVTNVSAQPLGFTVSTAHEGSTTWLSVPSLPAPIAPGQTGTLQLIRDANAKLGAGVHQAELVFRFSNGLVRGVAVVLVIQPGAEVSGPPRVMRGPANADACTPTKLLPVFTTLGSGFSVAAAWPSALEMVAVDDCGDPMTRGTMTVSFSNGDAPLAMTHIGEGRWSGTWQPRASAQNVVMAASAQSAGSPVLTGTTQLGGAAAANASVPIVTPGGVVGGASPSVQSPVAPGAYVAVLGQSMANGATVSQTLPLPADLAGTQAILAGRRLALESASDGRLSAVVPYDIPPNTTHQIVVRRGNTLSMPEPVVVASTQPAVFTKDRSGKGEGMAVAASADGGQFVVGKDTPAAPGGEMVIYASGLGPVSPAVAAGAAAPSDPPALTTSPVTVTIGGKPAEVVFAGLSPGLAGVYQVNLVVPTDAPPGDSVELLLSVGGRTSPAVTVAVAAVDAAAQ